LLPLKDAENKLEWDKKLLDSENVKRVKIEDDIRLARANPNTIGASSEVERLQEELKRTDAEIAQLSKGLREARAEVNMTKDATKAFYRKKMFEEHYGNSKIGVSMSQFGFSMNPYKAPTELKEFTTAPGVGRQSYGSDIQTELQFDPQITELLRRIAENTERANGGVQ
jgi:hypothetical protein